MLCIPATRVPAFCRGSILFKIFRIFVGMELNKKLIKRITIDSNICHGKPCIRGMRWPVEALLDLLGSGMTIKEVLRRSS